MDFTVRELAGAREAVGVEELQLAAWGRNEREVVPRGMLIALQLQGGLLAGAFQGETLIGFVLGFPTHDPRTQHSHMLAVLPEQRGSGAALALKAFQREWCLARGVTRVVWTYDPLRGPNANFNIRKLGATISRYFPDLYGEMSGINAGTPSDRVLAEWPLESPRVEAALQAAQGGAPTPRGGQDTPEINPQAPWTFEPDLAAPALRLTIPGDFGALLAHDRPLARAWRQHAREVFAHYLARGYTVTGFERAGGNAYLLERRLSER